MPATDGSIEASSTRLVEGDDRPMDIERVLAQGDRAYALCEVENDCEAVELEALLYCYAWTKATR